MADQLTTTVPPNSKNLAALIWLATMMLLFVPGLIGWLLRKNDAFVQIHAKEALNWSITGIFGYAVGFALLQIGIGLLLMGALAVVHVVFCLMGALSATNGRIFRVPIAIRLVK